MKHQYRCKLCCTLPTTRLAWKTLALMLPQCFRQNYQIIQKIILMLSSTSNITCRLCTQTLLDVSLQNNLTQPKFFQYTDQQDWYSSDLSISVLYYTHLYCNVDNWKKPLIYTPIIQSIRILVWFISYIRAKI